MLVYITDHGDRHTQAVIAELHKAGHVVWGSCVSAKEAYFFNLDGWLPENPLHDFDRWLLAVQRNKIDALVPISIWAHDFFTRHVKRLEDAGLAHLLSSHSLWIALHDKHSATGLAEKAGVPVPKSFEYAFWTEQPDLLSFPVVVKATQAGGSRYVRYAQNAAEVHAFAKQYSDELGTENKTIVQQYIQGSGCAFFALMKAGKVYQTFGHRRLRENPPTGGASTCCESFWHAKLERYGLALLQSVSFTGIAMVEFKYNEREDEFYFIEVNPKFWGSFMLSAVCACAFSVSYVLLAMGKEPEWQRWSPQKLQFVLPDIRRLMRFRVNIVDTLLDLLRFSVKKDIAYLGLRRYGRFMVGSFRFKKS